ncbi:MAG TPA: helix-turn-helix transcriptional regulator, partial [Longimicrobium sp.]|nr:helix-turn-helix transcriptional regulator [Longimicrobium sp.]
LRVGTGASVNPLLAPMLAGARDAAVRALGEAKFETECRVGGSLSGEAAVGVALGDSGRVAPETTGDAGAGPLGKREAEVAWLIADGLSNKEIGARLFISERTVDSHVRSMLNKLGFSSRAPIAAWVASSTH